MTKTIILAIFRIFPLQDELAKMTLINIGIYQRMKYKVKKKLFKSGAPCWASVKIGYGGEFAL